MDDKENKMKDMQSKIDSLEKELKELKNKETKSHETESEMLALIIELMG